MDDFFGWNWGCEEDASQDEDDHMVNRNDPMLNKRTNFSPYEAYELGQIDEMCEDAGVDDIEEEPEAFEIPEEQKKQFGIPAAIAVAGVMGGLLEEDLGDPTPFVEVKKVSLQQHNMAVNAGTTKKGIPLRPFEQWVQDVLDGKKTWKDDL